MGQRQPRADGDMRDRYPLLAEWVEADRRDPGLGARVAARLAEYRRDRTTGPTWWAVAEWVRPDLELVPDTARRWYASRLINRLAAQGWLAVADTRTGGGHLQLGPRATSETTAGAVDGTVPRPRTGDVRRDDVPRWVPGRLF